MATFYWLIPYLIHIAVTRLSELGREFGDSNFNHMLGMEGRRSEEGNLSRMSHF